MAQLYINDRDKKEAAGFTDFMLKNITYARRYNAFRFRFRITVSFLYKTRANVQFE